MSVPDFRDLDPSLSELDQEATARQRRAHEVVIRYKAQGYFFFSDHLVEDDVIKTLLKWTWQRLS